MGKIIFLDVDGTLVDYDGHTPESAVRADTAYPVIGADLIDTGKARNVIPLLFPGIAGLLQFVHNKMRPTFWAIHTSIPMND